jgi:hypothetical protein
MKPSLCVLALLAACCVGGCCSPNRSVDGDSVTEAHATFWHRADLAAADLRDRLIGLPAATSRAVNNFLDSDLATYCLGYPLFVLGYICCGLARI